MENPAIPPLPSKTGVRRTAFFGGSRVAFFGGSFDPPHLGHLAIARAAQTALALDTVLFAPVGAQPLKPSGSTASFDHRLAMTRLAIAGQPGFALSLADEPKLNAPNYTLETLLGLRAEMPAESELFCLMGADSFATLKHWHRAAEIPFAASLIVASRPGQQLDNLVAALPNGLTIEVNSTLETIALKGHDFSRADQRPFQKSVKGTGFSPYMNDAKNEGALAPEGYVSQPCPEIPALCCYILRNSAGAEAQLYLLPGLQIEISASEIREQQRIREQAPTSANAPTPLDALLSPPVSDYIRANGLYR